MPAGTDLMRLEGNARAMLTAERSALNTVQHLSGIATMTRDYVRAMGNPACTLLDTRKTLPGLRHLEKYATRMGGAANHRMGLWDTAMIKDNHVMVAGSVGEAVRRAVAAGVKEIICEVDRLDQIEPALAASATRLLLDNMEPDVLREAVGYREAGRVPTEASGGINLATIRAKAATGVDYVSVGRLTQSRARRGHRPRFHAALTPLPEKHPQQFRRLRLAHARINLGPVERLRMLEHPRAVLELPRLWGPARRSRGGRGGRG